MLSVTIKLDKNLCYPNVRTSMQAATNSMLAYMLELNGYHTIGTNKKAHVFIFKVLPASNKYDPKQHLLVTVVRHPFHR